MAFSFKGISTDKYGLKVSVLQPPQRAESKSETISIPGRPEPLIKNREEYQPVELVFEAIVTDTSKIRDIFSWLKGNGKLIYDDEPDKYYNALSNQLISVTRISSEIRGFTIKFICLPFAYSITDMLISNDYNNPILLEQQRTEIITVNVEGSYTSEPLYRIDLAGLLEISVNGSSDKLIIDTGKTDGIYTNNQMSETPGVYSYEVPRKEIYIDTALRIAYIHDTNKKIIVNEHTYGIFPILSPGINIISLTLRKSDVFNFNGRSYTYYNQNLYAFDISRKERWL